MSDGLDIALRRFAEENGVRTKGPLSVVLVITQHAKEKGLPLSPGDLTTGGKGQVKGLGKSAVQKILARFGIDRVLAKEAGRTSRGSIVLMERYVAFLNGLAAAGTVDLDAVERWWISKVATFFAAKPFVLRLDRSKGLRAAIRDLLAQAEKRQKEGRGTMYVGAVMQHLVGAKLDILLPAGSFKHNGFSVKDEGIGRDADFLVKDTAVHVTTSPAEALLKKCRANLDNALRPVVVTVGDGVIVAEVLAGAEGIAGRVDVLEIEQFIATNLYELSGFESKETAVSAERLIERYNGIIDAVETDPGLKVTVGN